jgi:hypothetical protein
MEFLYVAVLFIYCSGHGTNNVLLSPQIVRLENEHIGDPDQWR